MSPLVKRQSVCAIPIALALSVGCSETARQPIGPDKLGAVAPLVLEAKPSGPNLVGDLLLHAGLGYQSAPLVSTCPGRITSNYSLAFDHSQCLVVQPTGASYALTDDTSLQVITKNGMVTQVVFRGQDIIGQDGIQHETDAIPVNPPVALSTSAFTIHVHADNVPVWRLSGHTGGKRVAVIGTISIWDVVYRAP